ncbi:hypothetical protein DLAC_02209 [Tieghemostelium lacteum]|uniref:phytol kinase n=1 Tax=Tieghemostelium lacteum TaxID=361077 RepID=A0A152A4U3_TIELA|nr:hypothetical protein DLAC_02209 [Tieghemostelium lacteum]|eukprot:KYR01107.1 hypothetical protein DLAC_02209 [Tieghemostelium lacteum]
MDLVVAFGKCAFVCVSWLKAAEFLSYKKITTNAQSRKVIHIGTGLIFCLTWSLFPQNNHLSKYVASIIPGLVTVLYTLIGLGLVKDQKTVNSMSRSGNPTELLYGPASYGFIIVFLTTYYWVYSPIGVTAISFLCIGDGFAGLIGYEFGRKPLPWNKNKTIVGSISFLLSSVIGTIIMFNLMQKVGLFLQFSVMLYIPYLVTAAAICTAIESLPMHDWDNITVFLTCTLLFTYFGY